MRFSVSTLVALCVCPIVAAANPYILPFWGTSANGGVGGVRKIPTTEGAVIQQGFTNAARAFDGVTAAGPASAATGAISSSGYGNLYLGREWAGKLLLKRVEVWGPNDSPFLTDAPYYTNGGSGTVYVLGSNGSGWTILGQKPYAAASPAPRVVFTPAELVTTTAYSRHAVGFEVGGGNPGTIRIVEVTLYGDAMGSPSTFAWDTPAYQCTGVVCQSMINNGGTLVRTVTCRRDGTSDASESLCPQPKPAENGGTCALSCPYKLVFVGYKPFTYSDGSGWLHEGASVPRAGPMPSSVAFGASQSAITNMPCSILTTNALTYFVGISCTSGSNYCAYQCK